MGRQLIWLGEAGSSCVELDDRTLLSMPPSSLMNPVACCCRLCHVTHPPCAYVSCLPAPPTDCRQVRLALAGKGPLNEECYLHPGRKGCKVERLLAA